MTHVATALALVVILVLGSANRAECQSCSGIPDMDCSTIPPKIGLCSTQGYAYQVVIRDAAACPVENAAVDLDFYHAPIGTVPVNSPGEIYLNSSTILTEITNSDGIAVFYAAGGGCFEANGTDYIQVSVDAVVFAHIGAFSPDNNGDGVINLMDALNFQAYGICNDLNGDGVPGSIWDIMAIKGPVQTTVCTLPF